MADFSFPCDCCAPAACLCASLPATLYATLTDGGGCPGLNGGVATMSQVGFDWNGINTGAINTCFDTTSALRVGCFLRCNNDGTFLVESYCAGGGNAILDGLVPQSCSPFMLTVDIPGPPNGNCCGVGHNNGTVHIVITS